MQCTHAEFNRPLIPAGIYNGAVQKTPQHHASSLGSPLCRAGNSAYVQFQPIEPETSLRFAAEHINPKRQMRTLPQTAMAWRFGLLGACQSGPMNKVCSIDLSVKAGRRPANCSKICKPTHASCAPRLGMGLPKGKGGREERCLCKVNRT